MSSNIKPIKLWGKGGPNPPKVAILMNELHLHHEIVPISFPDLKKPEYLAINPNGRMPSIQDPNTDLTLWESGAIIEYLIEKYDTDRKLSFEPGTNDYYLAKQWLFFQMSGQGPYFGQAAWFKKYHHEKLPSAIERYENEVKRVTGVLEMHLSKQDAGADGPWLVGGKISYADLSFIPWQVIVQRVLGDEFDMKEFPTTKKWLDKMNERPAVKQVMDEPSH